MSGKCGCDALRARLHQSDWIVCAEALRILDGEPVCTTCRDKQVVPVRSGGWVGYNESPLKPCPVCAVPNPESPEA